MEKLFNNISESLGGKPAPYRHPGSPRFTSATLNMLKFIYGDLTPTRISELKAACRQEVVTSWKDIYVSKREMKFYIQKKVN